MPRINPEGQLTRAERLATVIAIAGAVLVHVVVLLGWGRLSRWTQEEEKKERLMVIRRVRDLAPPSESVPAPPRQRLAPAGEPGAASAGKQASPPPPPPSAKQVKEEGPEPPPEPELSPAMEQDLQQQKTEQNKAAEYGDNSVTVVTDLPAASFIVDGVSQLRGSGTYWVRKGAPPGAYAVTFNPVAGFSTPPAQSKELVAKGQIVFVGKYRRSTEVVVDSNVPSAQVTVYRPDNRPIDLSRPGRTFVDDLPLGTYTAVFKDLPLLVTPSPVSQALVAGESSPSTGSTATPPGGVAVGAAVRGTGRGEARAAAARAAVAPAPAPAPAAAAPGGAAAGRPPAPWTGGSTAACRWWSRATRRPTSRMAGSRSPTPSASSAGAISSRGGARCTSS